MLLRVDEYGGGRLFRRVHFAAAVTADLSIVSPPPLPPSPPATPVGGRTPGAAAAAAIVSGARCSQT